MTIRGSCHCGKVAYRLDAAPTAAIECNCSICRRKGAILATYTFGRHVIRHRFCRTCGCAPFGEGTGPDGQAMVAVNLRCAEDFDLATLEISRFDGARL
jgi:hypothetical protein